MVEARSVRRRVGEIVWKPPAAAAGNVTLSGDPQPCILRCGDPGCREWPDATFVDGAGCAYHLSECEVEAPRWPIAPPAEPRTATGGAMRIRLSQIPVAATVDVGWCHMLRATCRIYGSESRCSRRST